MSNGTQCDTELCIVFHLRNSRSDQVHTWPLFSSQLSILPLSSVAIRGLVLP